MLHAKFYCNLNNQERLTIYKKKHIEFIGMNQVELVHWVVVNFQLGKPLAQGIINIILNKQQHNEQFNHMKFVAKMHFHIVYNFFFLFLRAFCIVT
jgi:hypothetical protein